MEKGAQSEIILRKIGCPRSRRHAEVVWLFLERLALDCRYCRRAVSADAPGWGLADCAGAPAQS